MPTELENSARPSDSLPQLSRRPTARVLLYAALGNLFMALAIVGGQALENVGLVVARDILRGFVVLGGVAILSLAPLAAVSLRVAAMAPIGLFLFFLFSPVRDQVNRFVEEDGVADSAVAISILFGAWVLTIAFTRKAQPLTLSRAVCGIAGVMTMATGLMALPYLPNVLTASGPAVSMPNPFAGPDPTGAHGKLTDRRALPDIFYIVPDRYASRSTYSRVYNFNNDSFYSALEELGFVVNPNSRANYPKTFQSLASTLHAGYLTPFKHVFGTNTVNEQPVYRAIMNNPVVNELKQLDYQYVHIGNWWDATKYNLHANYNFKRGETMFARMLWPSGFELAVWSLSPVPLASRRLFLRGIHGTFDCRILKQQFELIKHTGNQSEHPIFLFAHIFIPHDPITMDRNGRCLPKGILQGDVPTSVFKRKFIEYVQAFNGAFLEIVNAQLSQRESPESRDIIILLQSDEGPFPPSLANGEKGLEELSVPELKMKMGIINALRYSFANEEQVRRLFEAQDTPINNWRIIMRGLMGRDIDLLEEERSYIYPYKLGRKDSRIFDFQDITERLD